MLATETVQPSPADLGGGAAGPAHLRLVRLQSRWATRLVYCSAGRGLENRIKGPRYDNEIWLQRRNGTFTTRHPVARRRPCGRGTVRGGAPDQPRPVARHLRRQRDATPSPDRCDTSRRLPNEEGKVFLNVARPSDALRTAVLGISGPASARDVPKSSTSTRRLAGPLHLPELRSPATVPQLHGHGFADVTSAHHFTFSVTDAAVADFGRDGDPDLVTPRGGFSLYLNHNGRSASVS